MSQGEFAKPTYYQVATEGSSQSAWLCTNILEPALDRYAGESFRDSQLMFVEREHTLGFETDEYLHISFRAERLNEDGIGFIAKIRYLRPRRDGEFWPEETNDETSANGALLFAVHDEDLDDDELLQESEDMVEELWQFMIDTEVRLPHKEVQYAYIQDGNCISFELVNENPNLHHILDEDPDTDIDLGLRDTSFWQSFSEYDMEVIDAIVSLDVVRVRQILRAVGVMFDET